MSRITELEKQITELDERKVALQKELELEKQKTEIEYPFEYDYQFYLSFDTMTNVIHINCVYINKSFALFGYFKNKSDAERAIELFGDEIKRLYVEE